MVDLLLGKTGDERIEKYQRTILYLPLRTRDENMGVLMVDNLLSQQEIPPEQIPILTAVAGQLGMAIKNSRLVPGGRRALHHRRADRPLPPALFPAAPERRVLPG